MPGQSIRTPSPLRHAARLLVPVVALFACGPVVAEEPILTDGAPEEGYLVFIGDPKQWDTPVGAGPASSAAGYLSVAPDPEFGALQIDWTGAGKAQFFVAHDAPEDYSDHVERKSALALVMRIDKKPEREAVVRMGCGYPCGSDANVTKLLQALPSEQWIQLSFDLKCFVDGGLDVGNVDTPFLITTQGEMALTIAGMAIVPGAGSEATISCTK